MNKQAQNPYVGLPERAFWKRAVAAHNPLEISDLWQPKFPVGRRHRVITAGSCFAQHFSRALVARGYRWLDAEPAPKLLSETQARDYNYGIFSFRTGNIYTARMLRQWLSYALEGAPTPDEYWQKDGRFYDPLRPGIEPQGFASLEDLHGARGAVLAALRRAVSEADVFVFTMGLTECWRHRDMRAALKMLRQANPKLKVLLTVSPVPLTATASGQHVLTATSHSKSVLRAVAGELAAEHPQVDYFPSYEIITHPAYRGMFYAPNQRSVVPQGVNHVMENFFACQHSAFPWLQRQGQSGGKGGKGDKGGTSDRPAASHKALQCDEEFLDAFG